MTTPSSTERPAAGLALLRGFATHIGLVALGTYAVGFLVANAYFGDLWVVDPSLLQTRYAAAGALWFLFTAASLLPSFYLSYFWNELRKRREPSDDPTEPPFPLPNWAKGKHRVIRALCFIAYLLPLTLVALIGLTLFVLTPFFALILLFSLGASPIDLLPPILGFHFVPLAFTVLSEFLGPGSWQEWINFRKNPHRAVTLAVAVMLHATLFGRAIYPAVPPSAGGARPLAVALTLSTDAELPPWMPPGSFIPNARVVTIASGFALLLVPRPALDSTSLSTTPYCPIVLPASDIRVATVLGSPGAYRGYSRGGSWPRDTATVTLARCP